MARWADRPAETGSGPERPRAGHREVGYGQRMIWVVVAAVVVLSLVVLGLAVRAVLVKLPGLERAMRRLQLRQKDAEVLQMSVAHLRERLAQTAEQAAGAREWAARRQEAKAAGRGHATK